MADRAAVERPRPALFAARGDIMKALDEYKADPFRQVIADHAAAVALYGHHPMPDPFEGLTRTLDEAIIVTRAGSLPSLSWKVAELWRVVEGEVGHEDPLAEAIFGVNQDVARLARATGAAMAAYRSQRLAALGACAVRLKGEMAADAARSDWQVRMMGSIADDIALMLDREMRSTRAAA
jgi:hypothetical protein